MKRNRVVALIFVLVLSLMWSPLPAFEQMSAECWMEQASRIFPSFPKPPRHLYVIDMNKVRNSTPYLIISLVTLQGIVNQPQKEPRIYLLWYNWKGGLTDKEWLTDTIAAKNVTYEDVMDPLSLISRFKEEVKGFIVYDPEVEHTINVATTMAGVQGAIIAHPLAIDDLIKMGLKKLDDLRGRWTSQQTVDMYRWAYVNLWLFCSKNIVANLFPNEDQSLRDYLIACQVFTFWLDPTIEEERQLLSEIFSSYPRNTPILGWFPGGGTGEKAGVELASSHGLFVAASDLMPNLTVHSAMNAALPLKQRSRQAKLATVLEEKVYVTFVISDGDNVQYCLNKMRTLWDDEERGEVSIGWSISPLLLELAPSVIEWYYQSASLNDYFVAGPSGVSYIYPSRHPDLGSFCEMSAPYLLNSDLTEVWILDPDSLANRSTAKFFIETLNLSGVFEGYHDSDQPPIIIVGKPYISSMVGIENWNRPSEKEKIEAIITKIYDRSQSGSRPYFVFVAVDAWNSAPSLIQDVAQRLKEERGNEFEVVRLDEFIALLQRGLKPTPILDFPWGFITVGLLIVIVVLIFLRKRRTS